MASDSVFIQLVANHSVMIRAAIVFQEMSHVLEAGNAVVVVGIDHSKRFLNGGGDQHGVGGAPGFFVPATRQCLRSGY